MPRHLAALSAHAAFVLAGLVMLTWPLTFGAHLRVECRGVEMRAGDVCHKAELDGSDAGKVQTYEERLATKRAANPVVAGVGLVVTGFALALLVGELRRRDRARVVPPVGPAPSRRDAAPPVPPADNPDAPDARRA